MCDRNNQIYYTHSDELLYHDDDDGPYGLFVTMTSYTIVFVFYTKISFHIT